MNSLRSALNAALAGLFDPRCRRRKTRDLATCVVILSIELVQIIGQGLPIRKLLKTTRRPHALTPIASTSKKPYARISIRMQQLHFNENKAVALLLEVFENNGLVGI